MPGRRKKSIFKREGKVRKFISAVTASGIAAIFAAAVMAGAPALAQVPDTPSPEQQAQDLANVPEGALEYYEGYWFAGPIISDPLKDWQPNPPPWKICLNESYMGNAWRANLAAQLEMLTQQLVDQGLAEPGLNITNSNGDINLQLTQLRTQVAQGCDLIMSYPGSATGLCTGIREAYDNGALFVAIDSPVTCPEGINVATNPYYRGKFEGEWIADKIGGKGNIVVMNGQPGTANTLAQQQGLADAVASFPDIAVTGQLYGMWTPSVAKSEMLKFLATHPQPVDAVFSTGNMGVGVGQALEQFGRPLPVITEVTNLCSLLAYWKEKDLVANTFVQDGGPMAYASFVPALHIISGQKPKVNTLFMPLPTITAENFDDYYEDSMTIESTCFANGKDLHLVPTSYWEQFFTGENKRPEVELLPTP